jgi:hypothetical protein
VPRRRTLQVEFVVVDPEEIMTRSTKAGLIVAGVLAVGDVLTPVLSDGEHPPMSIALIALAIGVVTLVAAVPAWRGSRAAGWVVVASRLLSVLGALPALFVTDVPPPALIAAGAGVALTVLAVGLLVPGLSRRSRLVEGSR